jgi:hypothetical protein
MIGLIDSESDMLWYRRGFKTQPLKEVTAALFSRER